MRNEDEKLREAARMLSMNCDRHSTGCKGCLFCRDELYCKINGVPIAWDNDFGLADHFREVAKKVEDHSADTGKTIKTRQERFLEMFPRMAMCGDVLDLCPGRLGEQSRCPNHYDCRECKRDYWFAKEDENV